MLTRSGCDLQGGGTAFWSYLLLPARTPRAQALQAGDKTTLLADQLRQLAELDVQLVEADGGALRYDIERPLFTKTVLTSGNQLFFPKSSLIICHK